MSDKKLSAAPSDSAAKSSRTPSPSTSSSDGASSQVPAVASEERVSSSAAAASDAHKRSSGTGTPSTAAATTTSALPSGSGSVTATLPPRNSPERPERGRFVHQRSQSLPEGDTAAAQRRRSSNPVPVSQLCGDPVPLGYNLFSDLIVLWNCSTLSRHYNGVCIR